MGGLLVGSQSRRRGLHVGEADIRIRLRLCLGAGRATVTTGETGLTTTPMAAAGSGIDGEGAAVQGNVHAVVRVVREAGLTEDCWPWMGAHVRERERIDRLRVCNISKGRLSMVDHFKGLCGLILR